MLALLLLLAMALAGGVRGAAAQPAEADGTHRVLVLLPMPPDHYRPDRAYAASYGDAAGKQARRRVAAALARAHGLVVADDWAMPLLGLDCYVMSVPAGRAPDDVAQALSGDRRVAWAQPMAVYRTREGTPDPLYGVQPAAAQWHLAELHRVATGRGVRVAVIDTGIDAEHPDLRGRIALDESFVDGRATEAHGTAVAGIIGARAGDGVGIAGVAPGAELLALRACRQGGDGGGCTSLSLAQALHRAIDAQADIVNLSVGGPPDRLLARLLDVAASRGVTVVAAHDAMLPDGGFPASHPGVLAVADAAFVPEGRAVGAPGRDVPAPQPGSRWRLVSGPSYAAAHVSGLQALLRELGASGATPLRRRADGSVDACASVSAAAGSCACRCAGAALARQP